MIYGIGVDIVQIPRIAGIIERYSERFIQRVFSEQEQHAAQRYAKDNQQAIIAHYAKRFAAKEAFAKAVGLGIGAHIAMKDISVCNDNNGKPVLIVAEHITELLKKSIPAKQIFYHVSLTDDYPLAQAYVICEYQH